MQPNSRHSNATYEVGYACASCQLDRDVFSSQSIRAVSLSVLRCWALGQRLSRSEADHPPIRSYRYVLIDTMHAALSECLSGISSLLMHARHDVW